MPRQSDQGEKDYNLVDDHDHDGDQYNHNNDDQAGHIVYPKLRPPHSFRTLKFSLMTRSRESHFSDLPGAEHDQPASLSRSHCL